MTWTKALMIRPNNPPSPGRGPKRSRSPKRGSSKKKGCQLFLLAWVPVILLTGYAAWWFVVGAGQLVGLGLAAVVGP